MRSVARPSFRAFAIVRVAGADAHIEMLSGELERSEIRGGRDLVEDDGLFSLSCPCALGPRVNTRIGRV